MRKQETTFPVFFSNFLVGCPWWIWMVQNSKFNSSNNSSNQALLKSMLKMWLSNVNALAKLDFICTLEMQTEIFIRWTLSFFRLVEYTSRHQKRFSRLFCPKQSIAHTHFCKTYPRSHRTTLFSLSCALLNTQGTIYDILLSLVQQIKKTKPSRIISVQCIAEQFFVSVLRIVKFARGNLRYFAHAVTIN